MTPLLPLRPLPGTSEPAQGFQMLDRVDDWLIERKLNEELKPVCRAWNPGGGSWFAARVHLHSDDKLVIPKGLTMPQKTSAVSARRALQLCRSRRLYF